MNPSISCVIPVYNGERFLRETLASVLAQSHPVTEIIVVDDGSTDGTRSVVEDCITTNSTEAAPIRYLWQANAGPAAARNAGIEAAVGQFIAFLDADDLWHVEKMERQLARFAARPELDVSVTNVQNFWMEEVGDEAARMAGHARAQPIAGYVAPSLLMRRRVIDQLGLFDATLMHAHVTDWFLRAQRQGIVVELLPDVLLYRRLHCNNRSRLFAKQSQAEYLRLVHGARTRQRAQGTTESRGKN